MALDLEPEELHGAAPTARPPWLRWSGVSLAVFAGVLIIAWLGALFLESSMNEAVARDAKRRATLWAQVFDRSLPGLEFLIADGHASPDQLGTIGILTASGSIFRFKLFDSSGRLAFVSDAGPPDKGAPEVESPTARQVFLSGIADVSIHDGRAKPNRPDLYAEAYVPARGPDGHPIGVVEVYVDVTATAATMADAFLPLVFGLPAAMAILFLVPAVAFLYQHETARRDRTIHRLASTDPLTGTLNRRSFAAICRRAFLQREQDGTAIGVFFMDVDRFKAVNDAYGHEFGDQYLRHIAGAIRDSLRGSDAVGRWGGDEFVAILPGIGRRRMHDVAQRILAAMREPFEHDGKTIGGGISLGCHLSPPGEDAAAALHAADLAVYHAKHLGRSRIVEYFGDLDHARQRRQLLEACLTDAAEAGAFGVCYQPLFDVPGGGVSGFEALMRLNTPDGAPIAPAEFIPVAETTGLIRRLGLELLRRAAATAMTWPDHVRLSVNLSPVQFRDGRLAADIAVVLDETGLPGHRLEVELTERLLAEAGEELDGQITELKALGISIAMDDFGTGESSIGYLWKHGFDRLKIDRTFLEGYEFDRPRYRAMIETLVALGHRMGMQVTVEGVEKDFQARLTAEIGCDQCQGFLLGQPVPAEETAAFLPTPPARAASAAE